MPEQHPFTTNRWLQNADNHLLQDKWFINRNAANETLSFAFMPNKEVQSIFLGTFPIWEISVGPMGNENIEFFYGSMVNNFWECLGSITEMPVDDLDNRIAILENNKLGITDILEKIERNPANCNADTCLSVNNYNNILNLKESFPLLRNIFITSGGRGPVNRLNNNNKNTATWLRDSLSDYVINGFNTNGFVKSISVNNIEFNLIYLLSPSNNANVPIQGQMNQYLNFGIQNLTIQKFRELQWGYFLKEYHFGDNANNEIEAIHNTVINNDQLLNYFTN